MNKESKQKLNRQDIVELKDQLNQEYSRLTQEYKSCEVMIESRVRQKDIMARQIVITRELSSLDAELNKQRKEENK